MTTRTTGLVTAARIDAVIAAGIRLTGAESEQACNRCDCRFGEHSLVTSSTTTLRECRLGTIECDACDRLCATWTLTI
jgi:hypothetical protein